MLLSPEDKGQLLATGDFPGSIHCDDRAQVANSFQETIENGSGNQSRFRIIANDNSTRWVIGSWMPTNDTYGDTVRFYCLLVDITDQISLGRSLEANPIHFETLTEALPQIVWSCDADGTHDYFSHRWSEFTGIQPEDITETTWKELVYPEHWERVNRVWEHARTNGEPYDIDYRLSISASHRRVSLASSHGSSNP